MKIGVVGPGAVGSFYGAKLARAGHDVAFLLRSDYEQVRRNGVTIKSPEGDFNARPRACHTPKQVGLCDLVIVALKSTANDQFAKLLPPLVGSHTAVLTLQNGLGNEEALNVLFPADQILGGLCFVCLNRISPGVVEHLANGKIELGEFKRWPEPRTHDIASAFRNAGVPCAVRDNLEQARWEKLVWNIPFNGLCVASCAGLQAVQSGIYHGHKGDCLTTQDLLADPPWLALVREVMAEVIDAGKAHGLPIARELAEEQIDKTRIMGPYKPSTLVDYLLDREIELESLFLEPLRRAQAKQVPTPRLEALCSVLSHVARDLSV